MYAPSGDQVGTVSAAPSVSGVALPLAASITTMLDVNGVTSSAAARRVPSGDQRALRTPSNVPTRAGALPSVLTVNNCRAPPVTGCAT